MGEVSIKSDLAESDDDLDVLQEREFAVEPMGTVGEFFARGLVIWRSAAGAGGDVSIVKLEFVIAVGGGGLGGESGFVEDGIEERAGGVAGEHASCAVGAVSAGSEAEKKDTSARVAESGDGMSPIGLVEVGTAFDLGD